MRKPSVRRRILQAGGLPMIVLAIEFLFTLQSTAWAAELVLFTAQEARELSLNAGEWGRVPGMRALSAGPQIIIRRPRLIPGDVPTIEAQSPTDLDVLFKARAAPVRMDSLNVTARKGLFSKSLTELLRPYVRGDSIELSKVEIPTGRFLLDISIADANGNTTDGTYRLEVGEQ